MLKLTREIEKIKEEKLKVDYCISRLIELTASLKKAEKAYVHLFRKTYRKVFPLGFISKIIKKMQAKIKKTQGYYFTDADQKSIHLLFGAVKSMLLIRDTNIIAEFENKKIKESV